MTSVRDRVVHTTADADFGAGPIDIAGNEDLETLRDGDRVLVVFADTEVLFTVIARARGTTHLGAFLTPWEFIHWRLDCHRGRWSLVTSDRAHITRCRRFYGMGQDRLSS